MAGPDITANRHYPRPDPDHSARGDAVRIATAFDLVDADIAQLEERISQTVADSAKADLSNVSNATLKEKVFDAGATNQLVRTPSVVSPLAGATGVDPITTIITSAYGSVYGVAHATTQVQVSADAGFTNIVADSGMLGAVTSWTTPKLPQAATLYARARHRDADGTWSDWSDPVPFVTADTVIATPTILSPASGAVNVGNGPLITSSAYAVVGTETHASSDWQLATDPGFINIVAQLVGGSTSKTSWAPSYAWAVSTTYYLRVRHIGSAGEESAWSPTVSFTTAPAFGLADGYATYYDATGTYGVSFNSAFLAANGYLYCVGGATDAGGTYPVLAKIDTSSLAVMAAVRLTSPIGFHCAVGTADRIYIAGKASENPVILEFNLSLQLTGQITWNTNNTTADGMNGSRPIYMATDGSDLFVAANNLSTVSYRIGTLNIARYAVGNLAAGAGAYANYNYGDTSGTGEYNNLYASPMLCGGGGDALCMYALGRYWPSNTGWPTLIRFDRNLNITAQFPGLPVGTVYGGKAVFKDTAGYHWLVGNSESYPNSRAHLYKMNPATGAVAQSWSFSHDTARANAVTGGMPSGNTFSDVWVGISADSGNLVHRVTASNTVTDGYVIGGMRIDSLVVASDRLISIGSDNYSHPKPAGALFKMPIPLSVGSGVFSNHPLISRGNDPSVTVSGAADSSPITTPSIGKYVPAGSASVATSYAVSALGLTFKLSGG